MNRELVRPILAGCVLRYLYYKSDSAWSFNRPHNTWRNNESADTETPKILKAMGKRIVVKVTENKIFLNKDEVISFLSSFEPDPLTVEKWSENLSLNNLSHIVQNFESYSASKGKRGLYVRPAINQLIDDLQLEAVNKFSDSIHQILNGITPEYFPPLVRFFSKAIANDGKIDRGDLPTWIGLDQNLDRFIGHLLKG